MVRGEDRDTALAAGARRRAVADHLVVARQAQSGPLASAQPDRLRLADVPPALRAGTCPTEHWTDEGRAEPCLCAIRHPVPFWITRRIGVLQWFTRIKWGRIGHGVTMRPWNRSSPATLSRTRPRGPCRVDRGNYLEQIRGGLTGRVVVAGMRTSATRQSVCTRRVPRMSRSRIRRPGGKLVRFPKTYRGK